MAADGHVAGTADDLRPDATTIVHRLRAEGIRHVVMISGDRRSVAERIGREVGVDRVYAEQSPEDKLTVVRRLSQDAELRPVVMVGDGVNDAPALAVADVGIALGAAGATVSSETADAVITVDRVNRVADAIHTGRRSLAIARQSVLAGMGAEHRRHGRRGGGGAAPGRGRPRPGGHRPGGHPQRVARAAALSRPVALSRRGRGPAGGRPGPPAGPTRSPTPRSRRR